MRNLKESLSAAISLKGVLYDVCVQILPFLGIG